MSVQRIKFNTLTVDIGDTTYTKIDLNLWTQPQRNNLVSQTFVTNKANIIPKNFNYITSPTSYSEMIIWKKSL